MRGVGFCDFGRRRTIERFRHSVLFFFASIAHCLLISTWEMQYCCIRKLCKHHSQQNVLQDTWTVGQPPRQVGSVTASPPAGQCDSLPASWEMGQPSRQVGNVIACQPTFSGTAYPPVGQWDSQPASQPAGQFDGLPASWALGQPTCQLDSRRGSSLSGQWPGLPPNWHWDSPSTSWAASPKTVPWGRLPTHWAVGQLARQLDGGRACPPGGELDNQPTRR